MLRVNKFNLKEYENKIHFMTLNQLLNEWDEVVGNIRKYFKVKEEEKGKEVKVITSSGVKFIGGEKNG